MFDQIPGRRFQLWEYHVSHGGLLIRSPAGPGVDTTIDILFSGVEYIAACRHLGEISVTEATIEEFQNLKKFVPAMSPSARAWKLQSADSRSFVVASALKVQQHYGDIFDSPFAR